MLDIHGNKKRLDAIKRRIFEGSSHKSSPVGPIESERNREFIQKFMTECIKRNISTTRTVFYLGKIERLTRKYITKDYDKLTEDDILAIVEKIRNCGYAKYSVTGNLISLRKFLQIVHGFRWDSKQYPECIKYINTGAGSREMEIDVFSEEQIKSMVRNAKTIKEKAMISFMYESACRTPDEFLHVKIKDISFTDYGAKINLFSHKTGKKRTLPLVICVPHLKDWIKLHPDPKSESYLWVNGARSKNCSNVMGYRTLVNYFKGWRDGIGVDNPKLTLYSFRRTRATHLSQKLNHTNLCMFMGWSLNTTVASHYIQQSASALEGSIMNLYGLEQGQDNSIKPNMCPRCKGMTSPEEEYCKQCSLPLSEMAMVEAEDKKKVEMEAMIEMLIQKRMEELKTESLKKIVAIPLKTNFRKENEN
ncbi:MAG: site-specific integrase [Candidatus Aenigmarchaeota archaeon]|nr:site-specific integrase [Candidatus Aenigmarchaeota archaeon]